MKPDEEAKVLAWLDQRIHNFADYRKGVEAVKAEEEANRKEMAKWKERAA